MRRSALGQRLERGFPAPLDEPRRLHVPVEREVGEAVEVEYPSSHSTSSHEYHTPGSIRRGRPGTRTSIHGSDLPDMNRSATCCL